MQHPLYIKNVVENLVDISGFPLINSKDLVDATQNTDAYTEDELNEILDPYEMTHPGIAGERLLYRD